MKTNLITVCLHARRCFCLLRIADDNSRPRRQATFDKAMTAVCEITGMSDLYAHSCIAWNWVRPDVELTSTGEGWRDLRRAWEQMRIDAVEVVA